MYLYHVYLEELIEREENSILAANIVVVVVVLLMASFSSQRRPPTTWVAAAAPEGFNAAEDDELGVVERRMLQRGKREHRETTERARRALQVKPKYKREYKGWISSFSKKKILHRNSE